MNEYEIMFLVWVYSYASIVDAVYDEMENFEYNKIGYFFFLVVTVIFAPVFGVQNIYYLHKLKSLYK